MHYDRKPRPVPTKTFNTKQMLQSYWDDICFSEKPTENPLYVMTDGNEDLKDHILMVKRKTNPILSPRKTFGRQT